MPAYRMSEQEDRINEAIVHEGEMLAGRSWYRVPLAVILFLAGITLVYMGLSQQLHQLTAIGAIFVVYAGLVCFYIRKAEETIARVEDSIDKINKKLDERNQVIDE